MVQFIVAGLVLGSIYALAASGLVITYVSTGVLNFAFGSFAFFIARTYYSFHIETGLGHRPRGGVLSLRRVAVSRAVLLRGDLPVPAAVDAVDQGRRDHRSVGRRPGVRGHALRQRGDLLLARPRAAAGLGVPGVRYRGDPRPGDRLRVPAGDRRRRGVGPALHRGRAERAGDGRLRGDDVAVGKQSVARRGGVWVVSTFLAGLAGILAAPVIGLDPGKFTLLVAGGLRGGDRRPAAQPARSRSWSGSRWASPERRPVLPAARQHVHGRHHPEHPVRVRRRLADRQHRPVGACQRRGGSGGALDRAISPQRRHPARRVGRRRGPLPAAQFLVPGRGLRTRSRCCR